MEDQYNLILYFDTTIVDWTQSLFITIETNFPKQHLALQVTLQKLNIYIY